MGDNIPGESFLCGNFLGWNAPGGSLMGGNFLGGSFLGEFSENQIYQVYFKVC